MKVNLDNIAVSELDDDTIVIEHEIETDEEGILYLRLIVCKDGTVNHVWDK